MASLVPSESVTITNNEGATYIFSENSSFVFEFVDEVGNTGLATATVTWIDKTTPQVTGLTDDPGPVQGKTWTWGADETASFRYVIDQSSVWNSPSGTFTSNNTASKSEGDGLWYLHVQARDEAGNSSVLITVSVLLDNTAPTAAIAYSPIGPDPTNQDVVATITLSDGTVTSEGGNIHTFTENGSFAFEFTDEVGNTNTAIATVDWIDKTVPTATFSYSETGPTNQDVVASLLPSEPITVTNNEGATSYTFSENGSFKFDFFDPAGNTGSATATVDWIDKILPQVTGLTDDPGPVQIKTWTWGADETATSRHAIDQNPAWTSPAGAFAGIDTANLSEGDGLWYLHVQARDEAGNLSPVITVSVLLDNTPPTATISYNPADITNQDVVATITLGDGTVSSEGGNTRTFTENGSFTFEFTDEVGNTSTVIATVDWIDKTSPTATLTYSTTEPTHQDVMVTLESSESVIVTNNGGDFSYSFTENGTFTFEFVDEVGNTGLTTATVTWIDKTAPQVTGLTDDPGPVQSKVWTWTADEMATFRHVIDQSSVWNSPSGTFTGNNTASKSEGDGLWYLHVQAKDPAGNVSALITVSVLLDNTAPAASIAYFPSGPDPTNLDVMSSLVPSEDITVTSEGGNSHTFSENGIVYL